MNLLNLKLMRIINFSGITLNEEFTQLSRDSNTLKTEWVFI